MSMSAVQMNVSFLQVLSEFYDEDRSMNSRYCIQGCEEKQIRVQR